MNTMKFAIAAGFLVMTLCAVNAEGATVDGQAFLEGQTDHSGIMVTLSGSLTVPAVGIWSTLFLLSVVGWLLIAGNKRPAGYVLAASSLFLFAALLNAAPMVTVYTNASGQYSFQDVNPGRFRLEMEKECFVNRYLDPLPIYSSDVTVNDMLLPDLVHYDESRMPLNMKHIEEAQKEYNNNSSPHTYAGDLACLVSGNGAGGVGFLDADFLDGIIDGYEIELVALDPILHPSGITVYWNWESSSIPQIYGCSGRMTFYNGSRTNCFGCLVHGADIGGVHGDESLPVICSDEQPRLAHISMQAIVEAEMDYNNNSSPHTYTGDLNCLVSGNGAGFVSMLCHELDDAELCNYTYQLTASEPVGGVSDSWFCTAWPVVYGGDSVMTFFVDDSGVVRGEDIGGGPGDVSLPDIGYEPDTCQ